MEAILKKKENQLIWTVKQHSKTMGYVVIDSMINRRSCGGLRMVQDLGEEEMRGLAQAMTLKYGFLGLPQGGAKAGVRGNPEGPKKERRQILKDFAATIAPLLRSRIFIPGTDMGTDNSDIRYMLRSVSVPVNQRELRGTNSGYYTAQTVAIGMKQAIRHLGMTLSGSTVAIEGFGSVGSPLAKLMGADNVRVVAISTSRGAIYNPKGLDVKAVSELAATYGSRVVEFYQNAQQIERSALLELPVDILCPCARHNSVHSKNVNWIRAKIICSGANNPVTAEAERALADRGVLCLPDFVTNCGGVLGGTMEFASVNKTRIVSFIERHIGKRMAWILQKAEDKGVLPRQVAETIARRRFHEVQEKAAHPTPLARLFGLALELYRRRYIPGPLVAALSLSYFEKSLA